MSTPTINLFATGETSGPVQVAASTGGDRPRSILERKYQRVAYRVIQISAKDALRGSRTAMAYFRDYDYEGHADIADIDSRIMERLREKIMDAWKDGPPAREEQPHEPGEPYKAEQHAQVLALAAQGLKAWQIARELGLTVGQVNWAKLVERKRGVQET